MKRTAWILAVLAVVGAVWAWSAYSLRTKAKYDRMRDDIGTLYRVVPMSAEMDAFLAEVRKNWTERANNLGGPHSQALSTIGRAPTVANLLHVLTHPMPPYSWVSPKKNKEAVLLGMVQGIIVPTSIDHAVYVNADGLLAMIRCTTNTVYTFADDAGGLREGLYFKPKGASNQAPEDTARKLADPQR